MNTLLAMQESSGFWASGVGLLLMIGIAAAFMLIYVGIVISRRKQKRSKNKASRTSGMSNDVATSTS